MNRQNEERRGKKRRKKGKEQGRLKRKKRRRKRHGESGGKIMNQTLSLLYFFSNNSHGHVWPSAYRTLQGRRWLQTCLSDCGSARTPSTCSDLTERPSAWEAPTWPKPGSLRSSVSVWFVSQCVCVCMDTFQVCSPACRHVFVDVSKRDAQVSACVSERVQLNEWAGDISCLWNVKRDNLMLSVLPSRPVLSRQQMACWHNKLYNGHTQTYTHTHTHTVGTKTERQSFVFLGL